MNPQTIVVLIVLAALLFLAIRAIRRGAGEGHCSDCNEQGCSGHGRAGACPSVSKALDEVDRRLGSQTVPKEPEEKA